MPQKLKGRHDPDPVSIIPHPIERLQEKQTVKCLQDMMTEGCQNLLQLPKENVSFSIFNPLFIIYHFLKNLITKMHKSLLLAFINNITTLLSTRDCTEQRRIPF